MESRFVTIAVYYMPHDADMAASVLEEKGIPTVIFDNNTHLIGGGYVQIYLQVPEQEVENALSILGTVRGEGVDVLEDIEESYKLETKAEPTKEPVSSWKDVPNDPKSVICPRCLSINSHKTLPGPVPGWLNMILLGLPGLLFPPQYQCRGCGAVFKP